ncbi:MAG: hypothetical protein NTY08_16820 [Proteobacteria bacterium]|nr:hypothetical protein [Pseudomonadota bacterium]
MKAQTPIVDIKLLTTSKDVSLRRLRNFVAPLGGTSQIFHAYEDVLKYLQTVPKPRTQNIIIHDHTVVLTDSELQQLQLLCRVFTLKPEATKNTPAATPPSTDLLSETYAECSLNTFFESPVIRRSMAQLVLWPPMFDAGALLGWGHATHTWQAQSKSRLSEASIAFTRGLCLSGEGRRLVEVFSHHLQTRLPSLQVEVNEVTFGSDGMLVMVSADCQVKPGHDLELATIVDDLRQHQLPINIINHKAADRIEIIGLYYPFSAPPQKGEGVILVFNRQPQQSQIVPAPMPVAS